ARRGEEGHDRYEDARCTQPARPTATHAGDNEVALGGIEIERPRSQNLGQIESWISVPQPARVALGIAPLVRCLADAPLQAQGLDGVTVAQPFVESWPAVEDRIVDELQLASFFVTPSHGEARLGSGQLRPDTPDPAVPLGVAKVEVLGSG